MCKSTNTILSIGIYNCNSKWQSDFWFVVVCKTLTLVLLTIFLLFLRVSRLISYWWQKCLESDCTIRCSPIDSIMLIIYTVEAPTPLISIFYWWTTNSGHTLGSCFVLQWLQVTCYFRFPCSLVGHDKTYMNGPSNNCYCTKDVLLMLWW